MSESMTTEELSLIYPEVIREMLKANVGATVKTLLETIDAIAGAYDGSDELSEFNLEVTGKTLHFDITPLENSK